MKTTNRILNSHDIDRIKGFLSLATMDGKEKFRNLIQLKEDLSSALILTPEGIPSNIVTMNSEIRLRGISEEGTTVVKLVFPQEEGIAQGNVSLLAPLGAALLGRKVGDSILYNAPGGVIEKEIVGLIFQPESAGDFDS